MLYLQSVFEYSLIFAILVASAKSIRIEDQKTKRNGIGDKVSLAKASSTDVFSSTPDLFPTDTLSISFTRVRKHYS